MIPSLPARAYYRAGTLGEGSYGSVACVYDDDGNEYAANYDDDRDEWGGPKGALAACRASPAIHRTNVAATILRFVPQARNPHAMETGRGRAGRGTFEEGC